MNIIVAQKLIYTETLSLKAQAVFLYLADRSNKQNICWPGLKRIAADCCISVSTVQRAIKELLSVGLVLKKANYRENGSQTSNVYIVTENEKEKESVKLDNIRIQKKMRKRMQEQAKKAKAAEAFRKFMATSEQAANAVPQMRRHGEIHKKTYIKEGQNTKIQRFKEALRPLLKKSILFFRGAGQKEQPITLNNTNLLIEKKKVTILYKVFY